MPRLHDAIDFVVTAYLVHADKVLLIFHNKLRMWLPVGGHIDPGEDPEQALFREIEEETGLGRGDIELLSAKPEMADTERTKFLPAPDFLDIHRISQSHRHISMVYVVKAKTNAVRLASGEHREIRWFAKGELKMPEFSIIPEVAFYGHKALELAGKGS